MAVFNNYVYYDVIAPDGTLRAANNYLTNTGTTGTATPWGAKLDERRQHYIAHAGSIADQIILVRPTPTGSTTVATNTITTTTSQGLGRDKRGNLWYIDAATSPDNVYVLRSPESGAGLASNVGTISPSQGEPSRGIWAGDRDFVVGGKYSGASFDAIRMYRRDPSYGAFREGITVNNRQGEKTCGIAYNGRDYAILFTHITTSPPAYYKVRIQRPEGAVSGGRGYDLLTRNSGFPSGDYQGPIDIDWDGRNWIVWFFVKVQIDA